LTVLFTGLAFTAAVVVVGIVVIVTLGVRRGLRPLSTFGGLSDRFSPDSLDVRFPTADLPPELAPIGRKFNEVLDRLSAGFARERMFAAAHELRAPLAELRTLCEVTLRWPDESGAASKALEEALTIATEMGGRVQSLMSLARCQAGVEKPRLEPVELGPVVDDCLGRLKSRAAERGLTIDAKPFEAATVTADAAMLESVVGNLLGNAVEHSPEGGRIEIGGERSVQTATLIVGNTSQAMTSDDLSRMFDTFWTKSADRHSSSDAGLGLALVAAQSRVMGAVVKATMPRADWLELRVEFTTPSTPGPL
jgi:signal transduction histidine kinase